MRDRDTMKQERLPIGGVASGWGRRWNVRGEHRGRWRRVAVVLVALAAGCSSTTDGHRDEHRDAGEPSALTSPSRRQDDDEQRRPPRPAPRRASRDRSTASREARAPARSPMRSLSRTPALRPARSRASRRCSCSARPDPRCRRRVGRARRGRGGKVVLQPGAKATAEARSPPTLPGQGDRNRPAPASRPRRPGVTAPGGGDTRRAGSAADAGVRARLAALPAVHRRFVGGRSITRSLGGPKPNFV